MMTIINNYYKIVKNLWPCRWRLSGFLTIELEVGRSTRWSKRRVETLNGGEVHTVEL